jgi:sugar/nucleoside kinase (ribokinase family)
VDDVVGCGSLNVDYIYETEDLSFLEPFYPEGEKRRQWVLNDAREMESLQEALRKGARLISRSGGGSAANTMFALARMGFRSGMLGKVGRDEDGEFIQKEMALVPRLRITRDSRTGQARIILGPDRDRTILLLPNANRELIWADLRPDFVRQFRIFHLTSLPGEGLALQERLAREVTGQVQISCDPGEVYAQRGLQDLTSLLVRCHILFITQGELELLTGRDWKEGLAEILNLGTRIVAVKKKGSGAFIRQGAESWELPAPVIQAKDTTGAGDVFAAGFLGGYLRGRSLPACGALGLALARQSMTGLGREAYPTRKDFEVVTSQLMKSGG